jgi:hypothetical protein
LIAVVDCLFGTSDNSLRVVGKLSLTTAVLALTDTRWPVGRFDYPMVLAPFLPEELVRGEWRFNDLSAGHPAPPFLADGDSPLAY